jgi:hypothetical protein
MLFILTMKAAGHIWGIRMKLNYERVQKTKREYEEGVRKARMRDEAGQGNGEPMELD